MIPLSEAMMLGGMVKTHTDGVEAADSDKGCALQLAMAAVGESTFLPCTQTYLIWPWSMKIKRCPHCNTATTVINIIANHLNDRHKWPLERIASWVRSIEPPQTCEVEQQSKTEVLAYA